MPGFCGQEVGFSESIILIPLHVPGYIWLRVSCRACPCWLGTIVIYPPRSPPPWFLIMVAITIVHRILFQLFAPNLLAAEYSPVFDRKARHNLMVHFPCFLFSLLLSCCDFCPGSVLVIRLTSEMRCIQRDNYIRALLHQPDESEMDIGMSKSESVRCYGRSRRFGDCCESENGCGRSVEEQAVLWKG